jgi:hypothetical protein
VLADMKNCQNRNPATMVAEQGTFDLAETIRGALEGQFQSLACETVGPTEFGSYFHCGEP